MSRFTVAGARINAGYTQGGIADKLGVSRATVNAWDVFAFCHIVDISEDDLILPSVSTNSSGTPERTE